jgi:hypothetical protein
MLLSDAPRRLSRRKRRFGVNQFRRSRYFMARDKDGKMQGYRVNSLHPNWWTRLRVRMGLATRLLNS